MSLERREMLDAWIIEEMLRKPHHHRPVDRPRLELPLGPFGDAPAPKKEEEKEKDRGVVIIDFAL